MDQTRIQKLTDYTSLFFAGVCAVHCFVVPVALILFPVVGSAVAFEFEEVFHELMAFCGYSHKYDRRISRLQTP